MLKSAIFCLLCISLLVGCKTIPEKEPLYFSQPNKPDVAAKEFFRRIRYLYVALKERQRLIEQAANGQMRLGGTDAQLLARLGPPDWKEYADGYPPKIPPSETWFYVHTWKQPMGPHYQGKMIFFSIRKDATRSIQTMQAHGFQQIRE